jgi:hypothetical protein
MQCEIRSYESVKKYPGAFQALWFSFATYIEVVAIYKKSELKGPDFFALCELLNIASPLRAEFVLEAPWRLAGVTLPGYTDMKLCGEIDMQIIVAVLFVMMGLSSVGSAKADYDVGWKTYKAGDYATALHEFKPLPAKGYSSAQFLLGSMYDLGRGFAVDYEEAAKWYLKAAE